MDEKKKEVLLQNLPHICSVARSMQKADVSNLVYETSDGVEIHVNIFIKS